MKRTQYTKAVLLLSMLVTASAAFAAELSSVKVVFDPAFTDRTNMRRPAGEVSELRVSFDPGFLARTNVQRDINDVGVVTVARDEAFMQRTNMGGSAMKNRSVSTAAAK